MLTPQTMLPRRKYILMNSLSNSAGLKDSQPATNARVAINEVS
jgi:hypothetical protein